VVLASEILASAAFRCGFEVKKSEIHGMAQRGGVVTSHVRYGTQVNSPLIRRGEADLILALEEAEGLRWAFMLSPEGILLVNRQRIPPPLVTLGKAEYPSPHPRLLSSLGNRYLPLPAFSLAQEMGNPKLANSIMLGAASTLLDIPFSSWNESLREILPRSILALNRRAFRHGQELIRGTEVT
jgi:indolepyruvate ferredoxin oxidoreductase beta subunit